MFQYFSLVLVPHIPTSLVLHPYWHQSCSD